MTRTRVAILTSVHRPQDPRILFREAHSLAEAGFDVTIVAAEAALGADSHGVQFIGVERARHTYIDDPERGLGRRLRRMVTTTFKVGLAASRLRAHIYHFHDPELLPVGLMLKLLTRGRVIYDVHEDVPKQIADKHYIPRPARGIIGRLAGGLERAAAQALDGIITATPPIARRFPAGKTVVVQNFPISTELHTLDSSPYRNRPRTVGFIGGLTVERGLRELVAAARLLPFEKDPALVLAGRLKPESLIRELSGQPNVGFLGWLERDGVARLLGRVRAGLVVFHPVPNYVEAYPIKLFEYMSAGLPVVASDFPLWREIVDAAGAGLVVDPHDPRAIAEAIEWIFAHEAEAEEMGRRGRQAVLERYSWHTEATKLVRLYQGLTTP